MQRTPGCLSLGAVLLAGTLALAGCGAGANTAGPARTPSVSTPGTTRGPCTLPALPRAGTAPPGGFPGEAMTGPAVTALRGGAVRAAFALDGADLRVEPPAPGQRPTISAVQAECDALAAAMPVSAGVAVGYGRVTVAAALTARPAAPPGYATIAVNGTSSTAHLPAPAAYSGRLAWIVVGKEQFVASCPAMVVAPGGGTAPPAASGPPSFDYEVFLVDARTGRDALIYTESQPEPCGGPGVIPPSAFVPVDRVSVPWRLVSRSPDGYAGEISATVLPCEAYPGVVNVERDRPAVRVLVLSPVDPSCGAPRPVSIALHAATVTSDLPAEIAHAPVGLDVPGLRPAPSAVPPAPATGRLENLGAADSGKTLSVPVGSVLAITPFPGMRQPSFNPAAFRNPTFSTDPSVLGPLDGRMGVVAEFRAWRPGTADLTIPTSACATPPIQAPPCTGPWVVHVRVT